MTKKIKYILLFSFIIILGLCTKSQARITTSDPTVSSGGTATITINSQEEVTDGAINVVSDGGLTFVSVSGGVANGKLVAFSNATPKTSGLVTYTFKVPKVSKTTTYKVTFSATDMTRTENGETINISGSQATATVTVTAEKTSTGNSSSGNNSSSGKDSSSSKSDSSSSKKSSSDDKSDENAKPTFTNKNETVYATGSVNVRSSYSTSSSVIGSLKAGDSVTRTGLATKAVNGVTWSRVSYNGKTAYVSSSYLTTTKPEESNNKDLKSLTIGGGLELTPEFSPDVTAYSLAVGADVTSIDINAVADDDNAKVEITGNDNLLMGENTIEIKVTAADETVRTYTINVTKGESEASESNGVVLSELTVEGYTLSPEFSSDVYEYTLNIEDQSVTSLNVNAKSNIENAEIEIAGNNELKLGENIITILVKAEGEDGTLETTTYQIVVNITEKSQIIAGIDNDDLFLYGGIALAVLIVLIIIIIVVVRRRHKNKDDEYGTYYGGFTSLNDDNNENSDEFNTNKNVLSDDKENFGADIKPDESDDTTTRRRGKHF